MAGYSTSSPPCCIVPAISGTGPSVWTYDSVDAMSVVRVTGYITNALQLGMKVGDIVFVTDTDASPRITTTCLVQSISAAGAADLSDTGATLGSTNSD